MLRVYVSGHCPGCDTARVRLEELRTQWPDVPMILVDVAARGAAVPPQVIGTPVYTWNGRVLFLGNPSEHELIERMRVLHDDEPVHRAR